MNLDEFIEHLEEIREEHGGNLDVAAQVPLGTRCWENSWTQFEVKVVSTDGGSIYLQCS